MKYPLLSIGLLAVASVAYSAPGYRKLEYRIPMRDGVKLYTAVYVPIHSSGKSPILMERTPYSAGPYGKGEVPGFGGSKKLQAKGYIFAYQDVRGRYMSEGVWENIRPQLKKGQKGIDESTDTYDTVDYLIKHVPNNNGAVGLWGISYPGFYAGIGAINSHPALKAVSPQAPVSDWFVGDDDHHNGAFFLQDNFDFSGWFDTLRKGLEEDHTGISDIERGKSGAYDFFLKTGALPNFDRLHFKGRVPYWNEVLDHDTYDIYWKARSLPDKMVNVKCAVLTVGGWFDAEDMWGALNLPRFTAARNPKTPVYLTMGPWYHGMWADQNGRTFGDLDYGFDTSSWYRENVEFPFFERYLRGQALPEPAKYTLFETGGNQWHRFNVWPPKDATNVSYFLSSENKLTATAPIAEGSDSYVNDPAAPTPYLADPTQGERTREYMIDDQRWASKRADVLSYRGEVLEKDLTVGGPVDVSLWAKTTGTDADFIVKVIDVWPGQAGKSPRGISMSAYEQNVRADVMRGKFRNSLEKPEPFVPDQPTLIHFKLNDLLHTFKKGHRVMVQIQSSWFPLVDRNPNQFLDINHAQDSDFKSATITILRDPSHPSKITFGTIPAEVVSKTSVK